MDEAVLSRVRSQLASVKVPTNYDKVYKDECMYSFADFESENGLFINMGNWHGVGARFLELDHAKTGNVLYYNEKHRRIPLTDEEQVARDVAPTKMAIGGDHGFQVGQKMYNIAKEHSLVLMPEKATIPLPCPELPELVLNAITAIQENEGASRQQQSATWEEQRAESKYARTLEQLPPDRKISPHPNDWVCDSTEVTDNLWLNLSTGNIGSGRMHWDGSGGNGAALKHFEETGSKYPLVVKLGTITPHGADVYSYAPDEDDMVTDPLLKEHLAHWGINMMQMDKTAKTMAEMEIDMNVKFEYNAITEGGQQLVPVSGPGLVGLKNGGNYCYMSSVLQALAGMPALGHTYAAAADQIMRSAPTDIAGDFTAQLAKVGAALTTGQTDKVPFTPPGATEQAALEARVEANSVSPHRFKALIGRGHSEFGSPHQQDACEFFIYLMQLLERSERVAGARLPAADGGAVPLSSLFKFSMEQRTQCATTGAVSYKHLEQNVLHVDIPLEAASNGQAVAEFKAREQNRKEMKARDASAYISAAGGCAVVDGEPDEPVVPVVPFDACLAKFAASAMLPDYFSPALGGKGRADVSLRLASFPPYLMVHLQKYFVDEQWRARKMEVLTAMQHSINLEWLRGKGPQPDERLQPQEPEAAGGAGPAAAAAAPVPDAEIVTLLSSAGFGENACKRAAVAVGNSDAEAAMNWLLGHMDDADLNDPLPSGGGGGAVGGGGAEAEPEAVAMLGAMGFTERQAKAALKSCSGNVERAADWLFSRADGLDAAVAAVEGEADAAPAAAGPKLAHDNVQLANSVGGQEEMLDGPGKYELVAIISHIGSNTACGHYVAHVMKGGQWHIYNDEKVALSEKLPIEHGYMYLYRRTDQPWV